MNESPQADREPASQLRKPGVLARVLRWFIGVLGGLLAALILIVGILMLLAIPIDLSMARERVEALASNALKRPFRIEGSLTLFPTLPPALQVEAVRIGNTAGWPDFDLLKLQRARIRLAVFPLLFDKVQIDEITVEGLELRLETNAAGEANWLAEPRKEPADVKAEQVYPVSRSIAFGQLTLRDVRVTHENAAEGVRRELTFTEVTGTAKRQQPLQLFLEGTIQQLPYRATLKCGSLAALLKGDSAWPLDLSIEAVGGSARLTGTLENPLQVSGFDLNLNLRTPDTEAIESILGLSPPTPHSLALNGRIRGGEDRYSLEEMEGALGETRFEGHFSIDTSGSRPKVTGKMRIPSIDVSPLFEAVEEVRVSPGSQPTDPEQRVSGSVEAGDKRAWQQKRWDPDAPMLTAAPLGLFDADINLSVDAVVGASFSLEDASLGVKVVNGELTAPMAVILAGVPFQGEASLGSDAGVPGIRASLNALGSEIGELAKLLVEAEGIEGRFGYAKLELSARGETLRELAQSTAMSFSLSDAFLSYGHDTGGRPVEFMLNRMEMEFPASGSASITARGALLGEPFSLQARGGRFLDKFVYEQWPVELEAAGSGARLNVNGVITRNGETLLDFELAGEPIGKLTHWIGFSPDAAAAYRISGELSATDAAIIARVKEGRLADIRFSGELGIRRENGGRVTLIGLEADAIDLDRLRALFPEPAEPQEAKQQYAIDVPILPNGIELFDSDIALSIKRLKVESVDVNRLKVSSRIRGGYVQQAPFQVGVSSALFRGKLGADLRGDLPRISFDLESASLDIGALLEHLDLAEGLGLTTEKLEISAMLEGTTARDMLTRSELTAVMRGGTWRIGQSHLKKTLDIGIAKGTLTARRDQPTMLQLDASIDGIPLLMKLKTSSLAGFSKSKDRIDMDADIKVADADIRLSGRAPLPIQTDDLHFKLSLKGRRFSDFDELLDVSLPPWGAYDLEGEFGSRTSGYYVHAMKLIVGKSVLRGNLEFDGTTAPPLMNLDLTADSIQLDDFDMGGWSAQGNAQGGIPPGNRGVTPVARARALLSPEVMRSLDGKLSVQVSEVLSGKDELGKGSLVATMERGRLSVDPLNLDIPGGSVDLAFSLEPTDKDVAFSTRAKVERLDYGYLARRIDPESPVAGLISLDVDVSTRGPGMTALMHDSNGHIDFAIWPEDIDATIFDLWATNLLFQVLPLLDSGTTSEVNCLVARFQLEDGIMEPSAVLVDTTHVQATAEGEIDFRSRKVDFQLLPRSKRPQMFSAETPLQVQGYFSDFSVGVGPGALMGTTVRIITSPVVVPFQWVFTKRPPADGEAACQRVWGRVPASQPSEQAETAAKRIVP